MAIRREHRTLYDEDGKECWFRGWNDPQVICQRFNGPGFVGPWINQLIPGVDSPDTCDTHLTCQTEREYFWKIIYLLRQFMLGLPNERILLRWGTADEWGNRCMFNCWKENRKRFYEVIDAAVEMCAANNAYLLLVLFGFADSEVNSDWHGLFNKSDPNHAAYVEYIRDVRKHLSGKRGVFGIDIANEADHEKHVQFWGKTKEERMVNYLAWEDLILNEIDLGDEDQCLVTIGHALGGTMFDYQWDTGWFITEPNKHPKLGVGSQHPYWYGADSSDYDYKMERISHFWQQLDKPGVIGEWGDFRSPPPAGHGYSDFEPWIDAILTRKGLNNCAMRMWPRPNWPVKSTDTPPVPTPTSELPTPPPVEEPVIVPEPEPEPEPTVPAEEEEKPAETTEPTPTNPDTPTENEPEPAPTTEDPEPVVTPPVVKPPKDADPEPTKPTKPFIAPNVPAPKINFFEELRFILNTAWTLWKNRKKKK